MIALTWGRTDTLNLERYFSNTINGVFYRIENDNEMYALAELYENGRYHRTIKLGLYETVKEAQQRAEKRENNKANKKPPKKISFDVEVLDLMPFMEETFNDMMYDALLDKGYTIDAIELASWNMTMHITATIKKGG